MMRILIFEDEKYNYDLLRQMLIEQLPDCVVYGPLTSIAEGKEFFTKLKEGEYKGGLDLIIADIQLNDGLSFYALTDAPCDIPIIFTTAYDEYALKAFEFNSLSYLLKPVDDDELRNAIHKAQHRLITDVHREEIFELLSQNAKYRERFIVKTYNGEYVLRTREVRYFISEQKITYAKLHDGSSYEIGISLTQLESELNPDIFMRVNRKFIIPHKEIKGFESDINGKEQLILFGDEQPEIVISRDNKARVHQWLDK